MCIFVLLSIDIVLPHVYLYCMIVVLEKKSATGANINDFSQSKNTRPSTPPSSGKG